MRSLLIFLDRFPLDTLQVCDSFSGVERGRNDGNQ